MLEHEPFLKAIFAHPHEDLPRLIFADWLDEHGDPAWAELIRTGCQWANRPEGDPDGTAMRHHCIRLLQARRDANGGHSRGAGLDRGFEVPDVIEVSTDLLDQPELFRITALRDHPEWYGATRLKVVDGQILTPAPLSTILTSPVTERVTELDLSGGEVESAESVFPDPSSAYGIRLIDFTRHPTIHPRMVDALAGMRECRRLTLLDLRNNDLDNMALNALVDSVYFTRLKKLQLSTGNRFRGKVWQRVLARFGEDVVE